ncbi:sulfotransferase [Erythrobacter litoralis]|uniref:sulfotransferase n=1 Tax=Erythrobacter litoralis TaxID=39960 RepID=UPI0024347F48|nr:sulfotransferase [Erythrobacter litoralis]
MPDTRFPELYLVGAAKAGTTTLVDLMQMHPDIAFPREKEPHHFFLRDDRRQWTIRDGKRLRPLKATLPYADEQEYLGLYADMADGLVRGDASTQYLVNEAAPSSIHAVRDDAKIVTVLRNPVERAYSAWVHARARGEDNLSFAEAIDACERGERTLSFATDYLEEGVYAKHLTSFRILFGSNVLVLLFEDILSDPQHVLDEIAKLVDRPAFQLSEGEIARRNPGIEIANPAARTFRLIAKRARRKFPRFVEAKPVRKLYDQFLTRAGQKPLPMETKERERLRAYYAPHNDRLAQLIDRNLDHWSR